MNETANKIRIGKRLARAGVCCMVGAGLIVALTLVLIPSVGANPTIRMLTDVFGPEPAWHPTQIELWHGRLMAGIIAFVLALSQTLVTRRLLPQQSWIRSLVMFSAFTALISPGTWMYHYDLWNPIVWSCGGTIILHALVLTWFGIAGKMPFWKCLRVAAAANVASYGIAACVLAVVLFAPPMLTNDRSVLRDLRGTMVMSDEGTLDMRTGRMCRQWPAWPGCTVVAASTKPGQIACIDYDGELRRQRIGDASEPAEVQLPAGVDRALALSADGSILVGRCKRAAVVYDLQAKRELSTVPATFAPLPAARLSDDFWLERPPWHRPAVSHGGRYLAGGSGGKLWLLDCGSGAVRAIEGDFSGDCRFSPKDQKLAWVRVDWNRKARFFICIYDCDTGTRREILLPEYSIFARFVWSPDGRYLAYGCQNPNRFAYGLCPGCIRVISADGKRAAVILQDTEGADLAWVP